jgi:Na+/proline symporter
MIVQSLTILDYILLGLYLLSLVGLGLFLRKRASNSIEDYFLAGKSLPWWAIGISGMGWSLDMTGTMLITSLLYLFGPRGLFLEFRGGVPLGLVFVMAWTGKWHRRSNCMTGAEWQAYRFGTDIGGKSARIISAVAGIVFTIGMLAYLVKGSGLFISTFIPQLSPLNASIILVTVTTLYTITSGFYGVVYSDILQVFLILLGSVMIIVLAVLKVESPEQLSLLAQQVTGNQDWMSSFPQRTAFMPQGYEMYECLFMFTVFLLLRNIFIGLGTGNTPQYFAARSEKECGKIACLWSTLLTFRWPMMMGYAILGLFLVKEMFPDAGLLTSAAAQIHQALPGIAKAQWADTLHSIANSPAAYPQLSQALESILGGDWAVHLQYISYEGTVLAEKILPATLLYAVPAGLKGLILVTLIAASMSTFDATLNLASALFTKDLYQAFIRPKAANRELLTATYLFSLAIVAAGFVMGYYAKSINDVWGWITMGLLSGLAIPGILRLYWWRFNGAGFAIGTFCGMTAAVGQRLYYPDWTEQTQFIVLTLVSLVFTVIGTYATPPTDKKILEHFYLTTRPFGFWKPFKDRLAPDIKKTLCQEHTCDLLSLPFIFIWMVSMYLLPMQLMIRSYGAFAITLVFFCVGVAGIYRFWYKNKFDFPENLTFEKEAQE